jgi:hypothetical protein
VTIDVLVLSDTVFGVASAWNSVMAKTLLQAWGKLWPAVMIYGGVSYEEGFVGFNVCNKGAVHEVVLMFEKLDPSNPECEASQVDVEEWTDADEGIVLSHTIANEDLINAVVDPDSESKTL